MSSERKGFYTNSDFWGLVNGEYMRFPTEAEYIQYIEDLEKKEDDAA